MVFHKAAGFVLAFSGIALGAIHRALAMIGMKDKIRLLDRAGIPVKAENIYIQHKGIDLGKAREIIRITCTHSFVPEPIRAVHLIGQGIYLGESKGNA